MAAPWELELTSVWGSKMGNSDSAHLRWHRNQPLCQILQACVTCFLDALDRERERSFEFAMGNCNQKQKILYFCITWLCSIFIYRSCFTNKFGFLMWCLKCFMTIASSRLQAWRWAGHLKYPIAQGLDTPSTMADVRLMEMSYIQTYVRKEYKWAFSCLEQLVTGHLDLCMFGYSHFLPRRYSSSCKVFLECAGRSF